MLKQDIQTAQQKVHDANNKPTASELKKAQKQAALANEGKPPKKKVGQKPDKVRHKWFLRKKNGCAIIFRPDIDEFEDEVRFGFDSLERMHPFHGQFDSEEDRTDLRYALGKLIQSLKSSGRDELFLKLAEMLEDEDGQRRRQKAKKGKSRSRWMPPTTPPQRKFTATG